MDILLQKIRSDKYSGNINTEERTKRIIQLVRNCLTNAYDALINAHYGGRLFFFVYVNFILNERRKHL